MCLCPQLLKAALPRAEELKQKLTDLQQAKINVLLKRKAEVLCWSAVVVRVADCETSAHLCRLQGKKRHGSSRLPCWQRTVARWQLSLQQELPCSCKMHPMPQALSPPHTTCSTRLLRQQ